MLQDPRAGDAIASFAEQWTGVDELEHIEKDSNLFPNFTPTLAEAMRHDAGEFAKHVLLTGDGRFETLMTASYTLTTDPELLALYGVTRPANHLQGQPIPLDPTQRAGILLQPGVMAAHAHPNQTSPIRRGVMVREDIFCQVLAPPPPNVDNAPPSPDPSASTRERFAQHTEDASCRGCHQLIDPLGFGLENYDAMGAFRTEEGTLPIDASGEFIATDIDASFNGGVELTQAIATSEVAQECVSMQLFRFALGRAETREDSCTIDFLAETFTESQHDMRALMRALVLSDAFRFRRAPGEED
jgi:hypothetical protein